MSKEIDALTGLRGIAAFWVLMYHVTYALQGIPRGLNQYLAPVTTSGYLGVDLFFVLSGFVIAFNYAEQQLHVNPRAYCRFLWKRLARLYPIHVAALCLIGVWILVHGALRIFYFPHSDMSIGGLIRSLLLIHAWELPARHVWNAASWSISAEWAAYICFPVLAWLAGSIRSRSLLLIVIGTLFVGLAVVVRIYNWSETLPYALPRIAAEFTAGVLLHRLYVVTGRLSNRSSDTIALTAVIALIVGTSLFDRALYEGASLLCMPILCCLVVYNFAVARGPVQRFLSSPPMQHAGHISYATYMVHVPIVYSIQSAINQLNFAPSPWLTGGCMAGGVIGSILLAHWLYRSIEVPARRSMLSLIGQSGGAKVRRSPIAAQAADA